eukprot:gnl/TRDRNA2_/TRDRNA2_186777_c0_seq1.p1 gnl/TRDRNA2_/TRDRNA2_186777_c0~~gnl/TRDRNA2_/TRDRNA2_186777_c0_seq1.p1  ORF type:complete len:200 (+),score=24.45 gnl/TRDRNA2_/TRDRNA2_186777_c0_seq1:46-645(+)
MRPRRCIKCWAAVALGALLATPVLTRDGIAAESDPDEAWRLPRDVDPVKPWGEQAPAQHLCCRLRFPGRTGVVAVVPETWNHSAVHEVNCSSGVAKEVTKQGTSCSFCLCLFDDGTDLTNFPRCCSLREFGVPGHDEHTGIEYCKRYTNTYNIDAETSRSCEYRWDLYPFSDAGAATVRLSEVILLLATVAAFATVGLV